MHAKQTMLAAALTVGTPLSLLSAVQAVPLATGTNLIAPFALADCMTNGDSWVEYEDWVASAGASMGVVVEDGVDAVRTIRPSLTHSVSTESSNQGPAGRP